MAADNADAILNRFKNCYGVSNLEDITLEELQKKDFGYTKCLNNTGLFVYEWKQGNWWWQDSTLVRSSACGSDPYAPSDACCTALGKATNCELSDGSLVTQSCKDLFDGIILNTFQCESILGQYIGMIIFVGLLLLGVLLAIIFLRYRSFGALLRKNMILWRQGWILALFAQIFEAGLAGVLAFTILYFTSMKTEQISLPLLEMQIDLNTPDSNRALIYQNLRPFGGLFFLIVFTYPIASMTVSLVNEKESRMKEAMRMAGVNDFSVMFSWVVTFLFTYLPMTIGVSFLTHYGGIFPNESVPSTFFFFVTFLFSLIGFSFLTAVFFSRTRPAAIAAICAVYLIFFSSFHFLGLNTKAEQKPGCLLSPVCLALGVNTMLDDSSLGDGFARAAVLFGTDRGSLLLTVNECTWYFVLDGFLYLLAAWYLDIVIPQQYGVRRRPDFFLQPLYPYLKELWQRSKDKRFLTSNNKDVETAASDTSDSVSNISDIEQDAVVMNQILAENLSKHYRINGLTKKRKAVDDLNVAFERNQITVLLGPNGAGKSTTFSMLTGLIEPTSGDVKVFGKSIRSEMNKIRGRMGYVPQHDILYSSLTVRQHLELFSALRGKKLDMNAVREMLKEMAIQDKLNVQSKSLSGGQKRKLCLAMAFIGDTDVVYLDEVSSGVDPNSRRSMWNVLQNNRKGRAIIITTHFMDEAEMLGDKIVIIANGKLCAEGTALELKQQYGSGYKLVVSDKRGGLPRDQSKVQSLVHTTCAGAELVKVRSEMTFSLPFSTSAAFPTLFRKLNEQESCSVDISVSGLEEVFLYVARTFANDGVNLDGLRSTPAYIESSRPKPRPYSALLAKRFNYAKRDYRACMLVLLLPILFSLGLLVIPQVKLYKLIYPSASTPQNALCQAKLDALVAAGGKYAWASTDQSPATLLPLDTLGRTCCPAPSVTASTTELANYETCIETLPQCTSMTESDARDAQLTCYSQYYSYCYANPWLCEAKACCDPTNFESPYYLCQANVAVESTNVINQNTGNFNNYCGIREITVAEGYVNSFIRSLVILLAFIFGPGSVIAFAVMEKEEHRNTKFQQLVNGVSKSAFWISSYIFDQLILFLPVLPLPLIIYGASTSSLNTSSSLIWQAVILVLAFLVASVPMAYALSFSYHMHARALIGIIIFNLVTGAALSCLSYVLEIVPINFGSTTYNGKPFTTSTLMSEYVRYILSIFPGYALADGLLRLQTQMVKTCVSYDSAQNLLKCTDLFTEAEVESRSFSYFEIYSQLEARVLSGGFPQGRFIPSNRDTLISLGFLFGMTIVFWLYVILRELEFARLCSCCIVDRVAKRHKREAQHNGLSDVPSATVVQQGHVQHGDVVEAEVFPEVVPRSVQIREETYAKTLMRQQSSTDNMIQAGKVDVQKEVERVKGNTSDLVQMLGLTKRYPNKVALNNLYLGLRAGEVLGYLGVNGAGKSTTIKLLTGYEKPSSGTATVDGCSILTQLGKVRSLMGYCPQFDALFDLLTVEEHLYMYAKIRGIRNVKLAVDSSIKRLNLVEFRGVISSQLSGGNKRKLSAAIAMLGSPRLVILDEPSSGVDPSSQRFLWEVITSTAEETQSAILLVSHSLPEVSFCCSRISMLINGKLRAIGTENHLRTMYSAGFRVEIGLSTKNEMLQQPEIVEHALGRVTNDILRDVCELLGRPDRAAKLSPTGEEASSFVAFALNTPTVGYCTWDDFSLWWIKADQIEAVTSTLEEAWGAETVDLVDHQRQRLIYSIGSSRIDVADIFELIENSRKKLYIEYYSVSSHSLDEIFNRWVEEVDAETRVDEL